MTENVLNLKSFHQILHGSLTIKTT